MDSCKMEVTTTPFRTGESNMSYSHLSIIERGQLEALHRLGWSTRQDRHDSLDAILLRSHENLAERASECVL